MNNTDGSRHQQPSEVLAERLLKGYWETFDQGMDPRATNETISAARCQLEDYAQLKEGLLHIGKLLTAFARAQGRFNRMALLLKMSRGGVYVQLARYGLTRGDLMDRRLDIEGLARKSTLLGPLLAKYKL